MNAAKQAELVAEGAGMAEDKRRALVRNIEAAKQHWARATAERDAKGAADAQEIIEWAVRKLQESNK